MAAQRCSNCAVNYPTNVDVCRICGQPTDHMANASIDTDWLDHVNDVHANKPVRTEEEKVELWRLSEALRLGYEVDVAETIAADTTVDLNRLRILVERHHVPLDLAARIA